ncbi:MAG TPA: alpha/beta fold hydrolase [Thermoanaerobaculia bacterium]|nr:alpha/beta fold hydrolase [Thermoanaerobaculia bacterium]
MVAKLSYAAYVPEGDGPFPTVIALHGWGANSQDLLGHAPFLHGGKALMLCPQGPLSFPVGRGAAGYGWFPLPAVASWKQADMESVRVSFEAATEALRAFIDRAVETYPIDRERVVVTGFSQGGLMAYELALREPGRFSGLVAMSTWLPGVLAETLPRLPEHEGFPVLVLHGQDDPMVRIDMAREARETLRSYGVALQYREIEKTGHTIGWEGLEVLARWLEAKGFARAAAGSP